MEEKIKLFGEKLSVKEYVKGYGSSVGDSIFWAGGGHLQGQEKKIKWGKGNWMVREMMGGVRDSTNQLNKRCFQPETRKD